MLVSQLDFCYSFYRLVNWKLGFPGSSVVKVHLSSRRCGFDPWVGKILWRRKWQPTPVFLPGIPHSRRSLAGYSPEMGCHALLHGIFPTQGSKRGVPHCRPFLHCLGHWGGPEEERAQTWEEHTEKGTGQGRGLLGGGWGETQDEIGPHIFLILFLLASLVVTLSALIPFSYNIHRSV